MNAPKPEEPIFDVYDCTKETPYEIEEVLKDKVWNVTYKCEAWFNTKKGNKKMTAAFFGDPEKPEYQNKLLTAAKVYGEEAVEVVKKVCLDDQMGVKKHENVVNFLVPGWFKITTTSQLQKLTGDLHKSVFACFPFSLFIDRT